MLPYALTIFTGAFLLFQVQPLIGKYILPWFGGGPGVWTTCMLFFQIVLLGGYAYAHLVTRLLKPRGQVVLHSTLLLASLLVQPITPSDSWKPVGDADPVGQILLLLTASLGLPYFVLSSTGPLIQQWFSRTSPGSSPYRLYALSNFGSLLALVSYPFFFETRFTRQQQATLWGWTLVAYVLFSAWCAWLLWKRSAASSDAAEGETRPEREDERPTLGQRFLWLLLPACASVLLLATTNKMCQDVAVIPFLWVLPLALYLLSFIIAFDSPRWYARPPYLVALVAALAGVTWALFEGTDAALKVQVGIYSGALFVFCMVCHGELYRLRPHPSRLTGFYLTISAGGALGGLFVALAAPVLFLDFLELHWGLILCAVLFTAVCFRDRFVSMGSPGRWLAVVATVAGLVGLDFLIVWMNSKPIFHAAPYFLTSKALVAVRFGIIGLIVTVIAVMVALGSFRKFVGWRWVTFIWMAAGSVALGVALVKQAASDTKSAVYRSRNFYGTLAITEHHKDDPVEHHFVLQHGRITHGLQFVDQDRAKLPTTYYGHESGVGMALDSMTNRVRHVGVIGLGTGTVATHGRTGDRFRMYEINPEVTTLAETRFSYLKDSAAAIEVVLGDARLSLEKEPPQEFDVLVLDAFSSDAIPVHLLTKEAFALYGRHMKTNGIIAVHISNRYLDLEPVVMNLAVQFGYGVATIEFEDEDQEDSSEEKGWFYYSSTWMLLTRDKQLLTSPRILNAAVRHTPSTRLAPLWTDDFASLFHVLD